MLRTFKYFYILYTRVSSMEKKYVKSCHQIAISEETTFPEEIT
jgi:hypothetical protein